MLEWNDKYNPFNSDKVLIWREWLEGCAKLDFLPPVTICVDPSAKCNLNCIWCNSADYNERNNNLIPEDHLLNIADFASEWGVKSVHIFGGGEPLMNPGLKNFLLQIHKNGMESGLITNGIFLNNDLIDTIVGVCRWIGISVDAGCPETYMHVKGVQDPRLFDRVVKHIEKLCRKQREQQTNCDVCVKYLLHPSNIEDVFFCANMAKQIGVHDFQIRPAGWENVQNKNMQSFDFSSSMQKVEEQMAKALELESETFHVYGIRHKFSPNMAKKVNYSRCWASPLSPLFGVDGNLYTCGDRRGQSDFVICSHYPDVKNILKFWNAEKHKEILAKVKLHECPRCVIGAYHEIIEKVFVKDQMCRNFP